MSGPLSVRKKPANAVPATVPVNAERKAKKFKPRESLRLLDFTDDAYYPTLSFAWRPMEGYDVPSVDSLVMCQLYRHKSVKIVIGQLREQVPVELERWVPVPVVLP
jgi:hypothetical protein